jgi:hypothetical protein
VRKRGRLARKANGVGCCALEGRLARRPPFLAIQNQRSVTDSQLLAAGKPRAFELPKQFRPQLVDSALILSNGGLITGSSRGWRRAIIEVMLTCTYNIPQQDKFSASSPPLCTIVCHKQ